MDTLNKVSPGDIRTRESFTEVYNDKGESVSGEKNEHSDGNLSNDNNLSSQSSMTLMILRNILLMQLILLKMIVLMRIGSQL